MARKLNDRCKAAPFAEPEQIAEKITDVVGYTAISDPGQVPIPAGIAELTELGGCTVTPKRYAPPKTHRGRDVH